jgi:hypothetical protein
VQRRDATIQVRQVGRFLGIRLALHLAQFAVLDVLVEGITDSDIDPFPAFGRDLLGPLLQLVGRQVFQEGRIEQVDLLVVVAEEVAP